MAVAADRLRRPPLDDGELEGRVGVVGGVHGRSLRGRDEGTTDGREGLQLLGLEDGRGDLNHPSHNQSINIIDHINHMGLSVRYRSCRPTAVPNSEESLSSWKPLSLSLSISLYLSLSHR